MLKNLTTFNTIPENLLSCDATELHQFLPGPSLIHLPGKRQPTVFLSVLLHGNEHTSWEATRALLLEYQGRELPRSLSIFIGNIEAAKHNLRRLDNTLDYNRIWGTSKSAPHPVMAEVIQQMTKRGIFLSVDIHNNTGKNPHYACLNKVEPNFLFLASLFSRNIVYFLRPEGVQSMAFSSLCPAVTVECGLTGETSGTQHALELLRACVNLSHFPEEKNLARDLSVHHTVATVKINPSFSFGFDASPGKLSKDILLNPHLEKLNFSEVTPGEIFGSITKTVHQPLIVYAENGDDVTSQYMNFDDGLITLKRKVTPAMLTMDTDTISKDCLCYFMEPWPIPDKSVQDRK